MADLLALAARCEAATEPSRTLDRSIDMVRRQAADEAYPMLEDVPHYTSSIDAAMEMVPATCLASVRHLWDGDHRAGMAIVSSYTFDAEEADNKLHLDDFTGLATSPALALCSAALRARAAGGDA